MRLIEFISTIYEDKSDIAGAAMRDTETGKVYGPADNHISVILDHIVDDLGSQLEIHDEKSLDNFIDAHCAGTDTRFKSGFLTAKGEFVSREEAAKIAQSDEDWLDSEELNEAKIVKHPIANIYVNPTTNELKSLVQKSEYNELRGVAQKGIFAVGDAEKLLHMDIAEEVGTYPIDEFYLLVILPATIEDQNEEFDGTMVATDNGFLVIFDEQSMVVTRNDLPNLDMLIRATGMFISHNGDLNEAKVLKNASLDKKLYVNPTRSELKTLLKKSKRQELRGVATKGIFAVGDGNDWLHNEMITVLRDHYPDLSNEWFRLHVVEGEENEPHWSGYSFWDTGRGYYLELHPSPLLGVRDSSNLDQVERTVGKMPPDPDEVNESLNEAKVLKVDSDRSTRPARVYINPTRSGLKTLMNHARQKEIRGITNGTLTALVDSYFMIHADLRDAMYEHFPDQYDDNSWLHFYITLSEQKEPQWETHRLYHNGEGQQIYFDTNQRIKQYMGNDDPRAKAVSRIMGPIDFSNDLNEAKTLNAKNTKLWVNPTKSDIQLLLDRHKDLRGVIAPGLFVVAPALDLIHTDIADISNIYGYEIEGKGPANRLFVYIYRHDNQPLYDEWSIHAKTVTDGEAVIAFNSRDQKEFSKWSQERAFNRAFDELEEYNPKDNLSEAKTLRTPKGKQLWANPTPREVQSLLQRHGDLRGMMNQQDVVLAPADKMFHGEVSWTAADYGYDFPEDVVGMYNSNTPRIYVFQHGSTPDNEWSTRLETHMKNEHSTHFVTDGDIVVGANSAIEDQNWTEFNSFRRTFGRDFEPYNKQLNEDHKWVDPSERLGGLAGDMSDRAAFDTDETTYYVEFYEIPNEMASLFGYDNVESLYQVGFRRADDDSYEGNLRGNETNPRFVLSNVVQAIQDWGQRVQPDALIMGSPDNQKMRVFEKIAKRIDVPGYERFRIALPVGDAIVFVKETL